MNAATALNIAFWFSVFGVAYGYVLYPVVVWALSRLFARDPEPPMIAEAELPRAALVIAAYNEAPVIEDRINNALALDYPRDRLEVVVASDGSDDGTGEVCLRHARRITPLVFPVRRGKAATLNAAVGRVDAHIVIFSDANTTMDAAAARRLVRWFADPAVGAVCGRLVLTDGSGGNADGLYWRYETFLKRCEGRLGALLGANGAIYAVRRELFAPLAPGTIVDDFVIPLAAKMRSRCRIVYDPGALAFEESAPAVRDEFRRRVRIGIGGVQAIGMLWPLLLPRYGWTAFSFWSHKVLRWACPVLLILALFSAAALWHEPLYRAALLAQVAFYVLCAADSFLNRVGWRGRRLLRLCSMFAAMNLALLVGLFRGILGPHTGIWARTARRLDSSPVVPARD